MKKSFFISKSRLEKILRQFSRKKILVFGDVGIDQYTFGKVHRISPEAPIPIVEVTEIQLKLGLASNVADNIVALNSKALLVGIVGEDAAAQQFKMLLKNTGISPQHLVVDPKRRTTLKERVVAETQQVVRIDHESAQKIEARLIQALWTKLERLVLEVDAIIIEDYAKGLVDPSLCRQLVRAAQKENVPVFVDPNLKSSPTLYQGCTMLTPNTMEAEALSRMKITDHASLCTAGTRILNEVQSEMLLITRGREGMALFFKDQAKPVLIPTFAREVFDVSGAGDTVIATLALAFSSGATPTEAALLANYAAGVEVGKRGTATVSQHELKAYMQFLRKPQKSF